MLVFPIGDAAVSRLMFDPTGRRLAAVCGDAVVVVDITSGQTTWRTPPGVSPRLIGFDTLGEQVRLFESARVGQLVYRRSDDGTAVDTFDVLTFPYPQQVSPVGESDIGWLESDRDRQFLSFVTSDRTAEQVKEWFNIPHRISYQELFAVSPDGGVVVFLSRAYSFLHFLDTQYRIRLDDLRTFDDLCTVTFDPTGDYVNVGLRSDLFRIETASGRTVGRVSNGTKHLQGIAVTPDGRFLLTVSNDQLVKVYDRSLDLVRSYQWKIGKLKCVVVSPDGTLAAAGNNSGQVAVWDWE